MTGTLTLVGVGPGDPGLLTLKAIRVLRAAPVVAYPVANDDTTIALDIVRPHLAPDVLFEPVRLPMTVGRPGSSLAEKPAIYAEASARLDRHLAAGRDVTYLCEGDPLFYGTAIYLLAPSRPGARVSVVPGVTSLAGAAAAIPLPLAARLQSLTVLTGPAPDEALRPALSAPGSVAIIKVGRHFDRLRSRLAETGREAGAWLVEHATSERQRVTRVADLPPGEKPYFSLILSPAGTGASS
jgi:precorrin-2 C(20)-methyltransferase